MLLMAALIGTAALTSCSDDDTKTALAQPSIAEGAKTVSSLAFSWQPVSGASQYAYELYDNQQNVVLANVTQTTSVLATGLKPNTEYTLKVWAYSPIDGKNTTSPIASITATTDSQIKLATPATPESETAVGGVTITWPAVEHATGYRYTYTKDGTTVSGETSTNSVTITGLTKGQYTISIVATSDDETYTDSDPTTLTFECTKAEMWRAKGTYTAANLDDEKFNAEIVAYDDGTYTIESPYGESGFSISFSTTEGSTEITPVGAYSYGGYEYFWVTRSYEVGMYCSGGYSSFEGNSKNGEVSYYAILYDADGNEIGSGGYDTFTWGSTADITVDDLVGTYSAALTAYDYFSTNWTLQEVSRTNSVTISKNSDGTLNIYNFYGWEESFTGTVDLDAKTITIQPTTWATYYTFADVSSSSTPVVASFDDNLTITVQNFTAWYGSSYYIESDARCVMTKQ